MKLHIALPDASLLTHISRHCIQGWAQGHVCATQRLQWLFAPHFTCWRRLGWELTRLLRAANAPGAPEIEHERRTVYGMAFFISPSWRLPKIIWFLMMFELPFTVANLALFGIASPNLYRTILWRVGGEMGFNSDPTTVLYAYANYRPVSIPLVWSNFATQYHLVIGVVCMFFWLVKATLWLLKVFFPILSLLLHIGLMSLWAYGIHVQTSPDTIDPRRENHGAPWYITKNCNIVQEKRIRGYCMQAKSSFAVSIIMMSIYAVFVILSIYSLIPTAAQKQAHASKRAEKKAEKEKWASSPYDNEMTAEQQWQHMWELQQLPRTPGTIGGMKSPMTPRTRAFSDLGGEEAAHGGYYSNVPAGGNGWHGPPHQGGIAVQTVSPVMEQDEYQYHYGQEGKGKAPEWSGNAY